MSAGQAEQNVRAFLKERFAGYEDSIESNESLEGVVDSLGLFELVSYLEDEFSLSIPNSEFSPQLFESIDGILKVIAEYRA
jgi:acyl carrier protein